MNSLPFEILSRIVYFLKGPYGIDKLSPYACISISWQAAIERCMFRTTRVKLLSKSLDQVRTVLLTNDARRVQYVRTLSVDLGNSPVDDDPAAQQNGVISIDEEWWTAAIARLFMTVKDILRQVERPPTLHLSFRSHTGQTIETRESLSCDMPAKIPRLECITSMSMEYPTPHIAEADIIALTDNLPSLKDCVIGLWDAFEWGRRFRIKHRKGTSGQTS
jgi:hypothetical protein